MSSIAKEKESKYVVVNGTSYPLKTPQKVIEVLEIYRVNQQRVRIFYGDRLTGEDWLQHSNIIGTIGRSSGVIKVPILLYNSSTYGGGEINADDIVRITVDKKPVYQHPNWRLPKLNIVGYASLANPLGCQLFAHDEVIAEFDRPVKAENYIQFLRGNRNAK